MTQASELFSGLLQKERETAQAHTRSVCMDTAQWPQELGLVKPLDQEMVTTGDTARTQMVERRAKPQKEQALNCPRCNSTNTKFCYYNNYSLTQPRYFCKTCRRYWTEGGSLRNVPVGGGSRKNKRLSSSTSNNNIGSSAAASAAAVSSSTSVNPKLITPPPISLSSASQNPNPKFHEGHDLNLTFPHHGLTDFGGFLNMENRSSCINTSSSSTSSTRNCSNLELLRSGMSGRGLGHFLPMSLVPEASNVYSTGFGMQEFRPPTLSFPLDGARGGGSTNGYGNMQENAGRLLFPFEDLKPVPASSADQFEQSRPVQGGDPHPGFWNAMMGGGGSW